MPNRFPCNARPPVTEIDEAEHIMDALGPMPREALRAMVDYGLSDVEIGRYFRMRPATVASLRAYFCTSENRQIGLARYTRKG